MKIQIPVAFACILSTVCTVPVRAETLEAAAVSMDARFLMVDQQSHDSAMDDHHMAEDGAAFRGLLSFTLGMIGGHLDSLKQGLQRPVFGFQVSDAYDVYIIWTTGPAYKSGLRLEDHIVQVNDKDVGKMSAGEFDEIFKGPDSVRLTVERGRERKSFEMKKARVELPGTTPQQIDQTLDEMGKAVDGLQRKVRDPGATLGGLKSEWETLSKNLILKIVPIQEKVRAAIENELPESPNGRVQLHKA